MTEPRLSARNIASYLGVTEDTGCGWIAEKSMPALKSGWLRKFGACDVEDWVRHGSIAAPEETKQS